MRRVWQVVVSEHAERGLSRVPLSEVAWCVLSLGNMAWAYVTIGEHGPAIALLLWHALIAFSVMPDCIRERLGRSLPVARRLGAIAHAWRQEERP